MHTSDLTRERMWRCRYSGRGVDMKTSTMNNPRPRAALPDLARRSSAAIWHPCTQMKRAAVVPPLPIMRGEGPWLFDEAGHRYFDATSSWWVNLFGHADLRINAAVKEQLDTLPHIMLAGCTHAPAVELAERLSALTDGVLPPIPK